jgi:hypothetical protein
MDLNLSPSQFTLGIPEQVGSIALVRPFDGIGEELLLVPDDANHWVIFLQGGYQYEGFNSERKIEMSGLFIPDVSIEIDIDSAFDGRTQYIPYGALRRRNDELAIAVRWRNTQGFTDQRFVPLFTGLPNGNTDSSVGFLKWRVFLKSEPMNIALRSIEVAPTNGPPR